MKKPGKEIHQVYGDLFIDTKKKNDNLINRLSSPI